MKQFEILPHTADLRIRAYGKTKEELFKNSLIGMSSFIKKSAIKQKPKIERTIQISSTDINNLLIDFLSEVLALGDINQEVYFDVKFEKFLDTKLKAKIYAVKVDEFDEDIKAVTYHEIDVKKNKEGLWEATVVYDI